MKLFSSRRKKLFAGATGIMLAFLICYTGATLFSSFGTVEKEYTIDVSALRWSDTGIAPWYDLEDWELTLTPESGCAMSLGDEADFWLCSGDSLDITFVDNSDDGIEFLVYLQSDLNTPITEYSFTGSTTEAFHYVIEVSPYLVSGSVVTASLSIQVDGM